MLNLPFLVLTNYAFIEINFSSNTFLVATIPSYYILVLSMDNVERVIFSSGMSGSEISTLEMIFLKLFLQKHQINLGKNQKTFNEDILLPDQI